MNSYKNILLLVLFTFCFVAVAQQTIYFDQQSNTLDYEQAGYEKTSYFYGAKGSSSKGYTDEEKNLVDNYYATGKGQAIIDSECAKDPKLCQGVDVKRNMLAETASKMYGMVVQGALGGKVDYGTSSAAKGAEKTVDKGAKKAGEKNEGTDYCSYGAMATEMMAMATQSSKQQELMSVPMNAENQQKETLYKVKRVHEERADTTKIQEQGWGVTAGCYVAMATYGMVNGSMLTTAENVGPRLAASAFLWDYFKKIRKEEQARADKVQDIIDKLPKMGDCNPITERHCFCSEETSKSDPNYLKYCLPQEFRSHIAAQANRISCLDNNMKDDPSCNCVQTKTCYDQKYTDMVHSIPNSKAMASQILPAFSRMSQGQMTSGDLAGIDNLNQGAVRKALAKVNKSLGNQGGLTAKQRAMAGLLSKTMPRNMANLLASSKLPSSVKSKVSKFKNSQLTPSRLGGSSGASNGRIKVLTFGGDGLNKGKKRSKSKRTNFFNRFKKKKGKANPKALRFAERAARKAQITQRKDTPIFDIISRRYKTSGWPIFLE